MADLPDRRNPRGAEGNRTPDPLHAKRQRGVRGCPLQAAELGCESGGVRWFVTPCGRVGYQIGYLSGEPALLGSGQTAVPRPDQVMMIARGFGADDSGSGISRRVQDRHLDPLTVEVSSVRVSGADRFEVWARRLDTRHLVEEEDAELLMLVNRVPGGRPSTRVARGSSPPNQVEERQPLWIHDVMLQRNGSLLCCSSRLGQRTSNSSIALTWPSRRCGGARGSSPSGTTA